MKTHILAHLSGFKIDVNMVVVLLLVPGGKL